LGVFSTFILKEFVPRFCGTLQKKMSKYLMAVNFNHIRKHAEPQQTAPSLPKVGFYRLGFKRLFDICAVLLAAPIIIPLIAILALMVARDGGRAFYTQKRVGRNGAIYTIWKLRSMVTDADQKLDAYLAGNAEAAAEWQATQKLKRDPRITQIGLILRKCSLDELPQLWNVLTGEMSLVGPRPMMPEQQDMYPGLAYYTQRPGITGSWQVSQRNETTFADRARFDTDYIANMSFTNDMKLMVATVGVVVKGTGY
jgi:lipopolysaccharide/colanic/teichoic acid biosynthesis glycosyltransferase